jgi:DNA processing protein
VDVDHLRPLLGLFLASEGRAGVRSARRLADAAGPLDAWWPQRRESEPTGALFPELARRLADPGLEARIDDLLSRLAAAGFVVDPGPAWPGFAALPDPPLVVFRRGKPYAPGPHLTVVGARAATAYGLRTAERLAGAVAAAGVVVVSGLARGIDAAAHRAALEVGGRTVAVLGSGPDVPYPPEHAELFAAIGEQGTLLTEHLPGAPPLARHFPRRNRLLAALGDAVWLVEARLRSGSLTTVRWAADLGRDVLVTPGPVDSPTAEGPLALIREGATAVGALEHLLSALGMEPSPDRTSARTPAEAPFGRRSSFADARATPQEPPRPSTGVLSAVEERLLALANGGAVDLDELVRRGGDAPSTVWTAVLALEARGLLRRAEDGRSFSAS